MNKYIALLVTLTLCACSKNAKVINGKYEHIDFSRSATTSSSKKISVPPPMKLEEWRDSAQFVQPRGVQNIALHENKLQKFVTTQRSWSIEQNAISNGMAIFFSSNGVVMARSPDGQVIWKTHLDSKIAKNSQYDSYYLAGKFLAVTSGAANVSLLDAKTGEVLWSRALSGSIRSAPLIVQGTVLAYTTDKHLYALHLKTGTTKWIYREIADEFDVDGADRVVSEHGLIVLTHSSGAVTALDISGKLQWKSQIQHDYLRRYSQNACIPPIITKRVTLIADCEENITALRNSDGSTMWTMHGLSGKSVWKTDGTIYSLSRSGTIAAIDEQTGGVIWSTQLSSEAQKFVSNLLMINSKLYVAAYPGFLISIDPKTGRKESEVKMKRNVSPVQLYVLGNILYVQDAYGDLLKSTS